MKKASSDLRYRFRLSHILTLFIIMVGVLPLSLVGLLGHTTSETMSRDISQRNYSLAQTLANGVDSILLRSRDIMLETRSHLVERGFIEDDEINGYLASRINHHPEFFNMIMILDRSGKVVHLAPYFADLLGMDWSKHGAAKIREGVLPIWSDTFISPRTGKPTLTMSLPLVDGTLIGYVNLSKLSEMASAAQLGRGGYAVIIDDHGAAVAHTDPRVVDERQNLKALPITEWALAGNKGVLTFSYNGKEMLGSVALVQLTSWPVVVVQPMEEAFAPVRKMSNLTWAGMLIIVVLAALVGLWSLWIVQRPISWLAINSVRLAKGDQEFAPPVALFREFEELSTTFQDMAESVRNRETALIASEQHLRAILDSSADTILSLDKDRHITDCNKAFTDEFGYERDEVIGKTTELLHTSIENYENMGQLTRRDILEKSFWRGQWNFMRKDGTTVPMELVISKLVASDGSLDGMVVLMRDISQRLKDEAERAQLEVQLRHSQKMEAIGTLAGGIAHDFNNILQILHGSVQLLWSSDDMGKKEKARLDQMDSALERATGLVGQLLTFSRKMEGDMGPLDLNFEVRQVAALLERTIPKMINIQLDLAQDIWFVQGNSIQVEQILLNLASNSRDAMSEGGTITVSTANREMDQKAIAAENLDMPPGRYVALQVTDTGKGMSQDVMQHIFEPFFTTKGIGGGTGLGLATVYGIVRSHGGAIQCSSGLNQGTAFFLYFPASECGEAIKTKQRHEPDKQDQGKETILLVDDEEAVADVAAAALEGVGYRVWLASDGEAALEMHQQKAGEIDLIVLDLGMPGIGGRRTLEIIKQRQPNLPVIIASGYSELEEGEKVISGGASGYIQKPFRLVEMLKLVRKVLDNR